MSSARSARALARGHAVALVAVPAALTQMVCALARLGWRVPRNQRGSRSRRCSFLPPGTQELPQTAGEANGAGSKLQRVPGCARRKIRARGPVHVSTAVH